MATTSDFRPGRHDVKWDRGDTVAVPILIKEGGEPADLTGRGYAAQIRRSRNSTVVAADVTVDLAEAASGILILRVASEITEVMSGEYVWDLQQTIGGSVRTLLTGRWIFDPDVTRGDS